MASKGTYWIPICATVSVGNTQPFRFMSAMVIPEWMNEWMSVSVCVCVYAWWDTWMSMCRNLSYLLLLISYELFRHVLFFSSLFYFLILIKVFYWLWIPRMSNWRSPTSLLSVLVFQTWNRMHDLTFLTFIFWWSRGIFLWFLTR